MASRPIAAVLDMDGLLLDSEVLYREAFRRARAALGLPPDDALFHSLIGTNGQSGAAILEAALGPRRAAFVARWDAEADAAFAAPVPVKPTVRDTLAALTARDVPLVVATSTRAEVARARLDKAGLSALLPRLVGGDQVRRGKPDPEVFLRAADLLGLSPSRCAAFEDSANGVRAAVAAGMVVTQIPDLVPPTPELRALGHRIAPDLRRGVVGVGLLPG